MTCDVWRELLGAYVDGELDANSQLQLQAHLAECRECTARVERLRARQEMMRRGGLLYKAPASVEARIRKSLGVQQRAAFDWRRWGALAAALLVVSALSLGLWQRSAGAEKQLAEGVVSTHVRALVSGRLADVASTDQHTVKPWFNGRTNFSPPVKDLAQEGFPLLGGRLDYLNGRTVAALVYGRRKHVIDVFIWPSEEGKASGTQSVRGYNVLLWSSGGMSYAATSDLNSDELKQFKALLPK